MALPPNTFGSRTHALRLERIDDGWRAVVDDRPLSPAWSSEREAWEAGAAEVARLDAVALALLRRARAGLGRKRS
jgi:hypothetical protein